MEKQKKKRVKKYISWGLTVTLVALLTVMPLLAAREETADGPQASILSGAVSRGDIATQIIGGGTLASENAIELTIPAAVKLTDYLVSNGDAVEAGQTIATVDRVTVMTAITQVQATLDYLAEEIEAVRDEEASDAVTARAGGTVKILYAQEGERVQDVMLRDGALAVLSLDGLMAVQVDRRTALSVGDRVCVALSDGTEVDGRVGSNLDGILTVTVEDDGYAIGEEVRVTTEDGDRIGSGTLYIHSQWDAVAHSGIISDIPVKEGDTVTAGRTLMRLEDTGHTAAYHQLIAQRREYEALMLELFKLYQSEAITAPCAGVVTGVDETAAYMLADVGAGWKVTLLANAPNGDDETTYLDLIGQVSQVGLDGLIMKMDPQPLDITDYKELSGVPIDTARMTEEVIYTGQAPVYELVEGEWVQIDAAAITAGDVLLFAIDGDGNFVWVVRVTRTAADPEVPDAAPSEPTEPVEPEMPTDPSQPGEQEQPEGSGDPEAPTEQERPGISPSQGGGIMQEEEYVLYGLETVTVASVTPQGKMTVTITVDELDITKLSPGQPAAVTVDALTGERFAATVTKIASSGESEGGNSKFAVELTLEKSIDMLPGMRASVFITVDTVADAVSVPVAALTETGTGTIIYTSYDEETGALGDPVTVTVGVSDGENAQILSGMDEGMTYYYAYYDTLVISDAPDMGRRTPFG